MKKRWIVLLSVLLILACVSASADNMRSLPDSIVQILSGNEWSGYAIGRTTYGDQLADYGVDACCCYDQYDNAAALVLMHSNNANVLCLFEKNSAGQWKLKNKYTGVVKDGNNIPLITSETYGTFRISYLDNDTNEKSAITVTKSGNSWVVSGSGNSKDGQYYIVSENGRYVNFRSSPDGALITRLGVGKPVTKISDTGNGWMKVSALVDGETLKGYVMIDYLSLQDPTELPQTFEKVNRFKVTVTPSKGENGHVNLRAEATAYSTCLRYLQKDDVVTVLEESNAWYKVRTADGATGYVVKAFVDKFALNN